MDLAIGHTRRHLGRVVRPGKGRRDRDADDLLGLGALESLEEVAGPGRRSLDDRALSCQPRVELLEVHAVLIRFVAEPEVHWNDLDAQLGGDLWREAGRAVGNDGDHVGEILVRSPGREQDGVRPLLVGGPFRRLLIGQAVSSLGDWVGTFALIAAALTLTGEPLAVGGVLVLRLVPPVFAAPLGGALADRMDRRLMMVGANLIMAGLIALVPFVNLAGLYIIAFVSESFALLFLPARDATVPDLVPRRSLPQANGLILGFSYGAIPIGAALFSGLRLASQHVPSWIPFSDTLADKPLIIPFLFDTVSFLFAALMIAGIAIPKRSNVAATEMHLFRGVVDAFRYGLSHPGIRALAVGVAVSMFGGGVLFALGIGYVRETLGGGDVEFGFLASLWGMGMALGIGAVRLLVHRGEGYVFQSAVAACGGILVGMAFLSFTWVAFLAALAFGIAFSVALILAVTLVQEMSTEAMRGGLLGGAHMLFRVSLAAGALGVGGAASAVGNVGGFFDGNQFGLLLGGGIILLGSIAAKGVVRNVPARTPSTSPDDPPTPDPT